MDLDLRRVIGSIQGKRPQEELAPLTTEWGDEVLAAARANPAFVPYGDSHPCPQLVRRFSWRSLNGWWECSFVPCADAATAWRDATPPKGMAKAILVPFSPEARLSGVGRQLKPDELLWYRRELPVVELAAGERCLLHFDGVDHACVVWLGGRRLAEHEGAYLPFVVDVTDELAEGARTLDLCVFDPSETGTQLRGKQRLDRGTMWYTAQSGIWKDVWLEVVPATHITDLRVTVDADAMTLGVEASLALGEPHAGMWGTPAAPRLVVTLRDDDDEAIVSMTAAIVPDEDESGLGHASAQTGVGWPLHLWSPDDPHLYPVSAWVTGGGDKVDSYVAARTVEVAPDEQGVPRVLLNHEPVFLRGLLDQGYWPDGLLTPPSQAAIEADVLTAREMGFNLLRKHIKVESDRWYAACDRLGMLVWQDMPSGGSPLSDWQTQQKPTLFSASWSRMRDDTPKAWGKLAAGDARYRGEWLGTCRETVRRLSSHPSVVAWVVFNESWGQFCAAEQTEMVRGIDPTRPVLSASGWYDQGSGDLFGVHNYFRGMHLFSDPLGPSSPRAQVVSEFGGLTWHVDGHSSLARSYGYATYETLDEWRDGVLDLLDRADALEDEGLAGFVYTQLTDVEEETNGLLTYDRRVRKL